MSTQQNAYLIEIVHRYNLQGISLQGLSPLPEINLQVIGEGTLFSIHRAEVTEQQLRLIIPYLEMAEKNGDIIAYFYQNKARF